MTEPRFVAVAVTGYSEKGGARPLSSWSVLDRLDCYHEVARFYALPELMLSDTAREVKARSEAERLNREYAT